MNTIDLLEVNRCLEKCVKLEIYAYINNKGRVHTDNIRPLNIALKDIAGIDGDIFKMDEEEYNNTILANASPADFGEWYDTPDAKVCVVVLTSDYDAYMTAQEAVDRVIATYLHLETYDPRALIEALEYVNTAAESSYYYSSVEEESQAKIDLRKPKITNYLIDTIYSGTKYEK
ncbi:MAG: hypothetical protein IKM47_06495 [Bacteroidaceae bacterium]|nr:hypothetical protein [Bacteroidaceae bacterium]